MAVIQGRTRIQLETAIGRNLSPKIFVGSWTAVSNTTTNTDTKWKGGADDANGMWLHATSGGEAGEIVRVTDDNGSGQLTHDALSGTPTNGETYILWPEEFNPNDIHEFINSAIIEVSGRFYDDVEDITLFADGAQKVFSIPSGISMIQKLQYRSVFKSKTIDNANSAWTGGTGVTVDADTSLKKEGTASNKLTIGAVDAGDIIAYKNFSAMDLSDYTHIEWWSRATFDTTAGDYKLLLSSTAAGVSAEEVLPFPAVGNDAWVFHRVAAGQIKRVAAIISVGIEDDVGNNDDVTLWIDDIRATHSQEQSFTDVPKRLWSVDRSSRTLHLTESARSMIGYNMLKIIGGDKPALLSADTDTTEVSDAFIIARATALALSSADEMEGRRDLAGFWEQKANRAYRNFPMLVDVRVVE